MEGSVSYIASDCYSPDTQKSPRCPESAGSPRACAFFFLRSAPTHLHPSGGATSGQREEQTLVQILLCSHIMEFICVASQVEKGGLIFIHFQTEAFINFVNISQFQPMPIKLNNELGKMCACLALIKGVGGLYDAHN